MVFADTNYWHQPLTVVIMAFTGKYVLEKEENLEEFLKAVGEEPTLKSHINTGLKCNIILL